MSSSGMTEVAKATVTIIPNMQGAQQEIAESLGASTETAAKDAGEKGGKTLSESLGGALSAAGEKMGAIGDTMNKCVTVPIAAAATASVASWKEVDEAMDTVTIKTGASGDALADMQDRAKNIAETLPVSFQSAGDAIGEVNTRFGLTGDSLEKLSTHFVKFAELNGTDVTASVDSVQKALSAFGLSADDAGAMLDSLNQAGQASGASVLQLADNLTKNATAFQSMGLTAQDSVDLLSKLEKSGIDSSNVLTGVAKLQATAAKDGNTMLEEFEYALQDSQGACEVFGAKAGPKLYEAFHNGTLSAEDFIGKGAELTENLGNVSSTFDETLDPLDQFTVVMNNLKSTGAELVDLLGPTIQQVLDTLTDIIKKVVDAWNGLDEEQQANIVKFALVAAAIGPMLTALSKGIDTFMKIKQSVGAFGDALKLLKAGPIVLIVAAIAAAVLLIITHFDEIKAAFGKLKEALSTIMNNIKTAITTVWNGIKTAVMSVVNGIKTGISTAFNAVKNTISTIFNGIKSVTTTIWNGIKTAITKPIEAAKTAVSNVINGIKRVFSGLKLQLPEFKLPHFKASGGKPPWGLLGKGSLPKLSVEWYAKAAEEGALFTRPQLIGVGDAAQPEMLIGQDKLKEMISKASRPNFNVNMTIYAAEGMDTKQLAQQVADELQYRVDRESRAFA